MEVRARRPKLRGEGFLALAYGLLFGRISPSRSFARGHREDIVPCRNHFVPEPRDAAGLAAEWKPGPDGIRIKDGVRAKVNYLTTSGSAPRQKSAQIIQANLKEIGIDVAITFQPASVVFSRDGVYGRNFDLMEIGPFFDTGDPGSWLYTGFHCDQIPSPANGFTGNNLSGWCNRDVSDATARQAFLTLDDAERAKDWEVIVKGFFAPPVGGDCKTGGYPMVPLHTRPRLMATSPRLN
jgi:peptide/nickel transport system substrate-binding protein